MQSRKQKFARDHIFAYGADMLPGCGRGQDLDTAAGDRLHIFHHDHGVAAGGQRISCIHRQAIITHRQPERILICGAESTLCLHGEAVHGCGMVPRHGQPGEKRLCGNPPQGFACFDILNKAGYLHGGKKLLLRFLPGNIAQIYFLHGCGLLSCGEPPGASGVTPR